MTCDVQYVYYVKSAGLPSGVSGSRGRNARARFVWPFGGSSGGRGGAGDPKRAGPINSILDTRLVTVAHSGSLYQ